MFFPSVTENKIHIKCDWMQKITSPCFTPGQDNPNNRVQNLRSLHSTTKQIKRGENRRGHLIFHGQRSAASTSASIPYHYNTFIYTIYIIRVTRLVFERTTYIYSALRVIGICWAYTTEKRTRIQDDDNSIRRVHGGGGDN